MTAYRVTRIAFTLCLVTTLGCGSDDSDDSPDAGGGVDAAEPCPGASIPFTPSNFDKCAIAGASAALTVPGGTWTLNTDNGTLTEQGMSPATLDERVQITQQDGPEMQVFSFQNLTIADGAILHIEGSRPAVIVSTDNMSIAGVVSVSGRGAERGAGGGNATYCSNGQGQDGAQQTDAQGDMGGSGGAGAGFGSSGGNGSGIDGALGGTIEGGAVGLEALRPLRGGCRGGTGGIGANASTEGGAGGGAGGAIHLVARNQIAIEATGTIMASGGAGGGGQAPSAGGGGGGSGGAILLEASTVTVNGHVLALGGGGGEGADDSAAGNAGSEAGAQSTTPPAGGSGGSDGGAGGQGAASTAQPAGGGSAGQSNSVAGVAHGGGGGGGSFGRIRFNGFGTVDGDFAGQKVVPPATTNQ